MIEGDFIESRDKPRFVEGIVRIKRGSKSDIQVILGEGGAQMNGNVGNQQMNGSFQQPNGMAARQPAVAFVNQQQSNGFSSQQQPSNFASQSPHGLSLYQKSSGISSNTKPAGTSNGFSFSSYIPKTESVAMPPPSATFGGINDMQMSTAAVPAVFQQHSAPAITQQQFIPMQQPSAPQHQPAPNRFFSRFKRA
jgi:hypothetical protein